MFLTTLSPTMQLGKTFISMHGVAVMTPVTPSTNLLTAAEKKVIAKLMREDLEEAMARAITVIMADRVNAGYEELAAQLVLLTGLCVPGLAVFDKKQPVTLSERDEGKCSMTMSLRDYDGNYHEVAPGLRKVLQAFVDRPEVKNQLGDITVDPRYFKSWVYIHVYFHATGCEDHTQ